MPRARPVLTIEPRPLFHVEERRAPSRAQIDAAVRDAERLCAMRSADAEAMVRVGITFSDAAWTGRIKQLDSDIFALDQAVDAELKAIKARTPTGELPNAHDRAVLAWMPNYTAYKLDWSAFKASEPWGTTDNQQVLYVYEMRFRQLHTQWMKFATAIKPSVPLSPEPEKPKTLVEEVGAVADKVPWGWIAGGAAAIGVGIALSSVARIVRG